MKPELTALIIYLFPSHLPKSPFHRLRLQLPQAPTRLFFTTSPPQRRFLFCSSYSILTLSNSNSCSGSPESEITRESHPNNTFTRLKFHLHRPPIPGNLERICYCSRYQIILQKYTFPKVQLTSGNSRMLSSQPVKSTIWPHCILRNASVLMDLAVVFDYTDSHRNTWNRLRLIEYCLLAKVHMTAG